MDRNERINALHRVFQARKTPITVPQLMDELGCSRATVYRDIAYLRDALRAPVIGDGEHGFRYDRSENDRFELPGLWLSSEELLALLAAQSLFGRISGNILNSALAPLQGRIEKLLAEQSGNKQWPVERVRMIAHKARHMDEQSFRQVASAVLERKQIEFEYLARSTDERMRRHVSPQRITHYRGNWYLDAWDHDREALRSFSVDRMSQVKSVDTPARDIDEAALSKHLADGYGIFSGEAKGTAVIRFGAKSARWVADEHWHSRQEGRFLPDGRYELKLPYSNGRELLMDVLQYGADAEIVEPVALREQAKTLLRLALANYD